MTRSLLPPLTTAEVLDELRIRAAANRKTAVEATREKWTVQAKVCERTARELECLISWITNRGIE